MRILELFSGTGTLSRVAREMGHETITVDNDYACGADWCLNIAERDEWRFFQPPLYEFDMVWASPPCESFSVASIGTHWGGGAKAYEPKTKQAQSALSLINELALLIDTIGPKVWYIENPRGVMRKVSPYEKIPDFFTRHTVTYCQYGDTRMKPTDIWTNNPNWVPRPMCKNGAPCHEPAPRGAKTGTQGRGSYLSRSRLPEELCREVIEAAL
jgi:hypothetical protein